MSTLDEDDFVVLIVMDDEEYGIRKSDNDNDEMMCLKLK